MSNKISTAGNGLFGISLTAALAGFIFGFDMVVISGADKAIQSLWQTSPWFHGFFIMSMALWGTVIGSIFGGAPTEKFGRKKILMLVGILFTISSIGSALAQDPYLFSFFRLLGGIGIGISSVAAPTYISEISTARSRGRLVAMYQFNIVFGILIAYLSNYFLEGIGGENDWRWMLGVMTVPSLIYCIMVFTIPESPRWLISKKADIEGARAVMGRLGLEGFQEMVESLFKGEGRREEGAGRRDEGESNSTQNPKLKSQNFSDRKHFRIIGLAFMIAFFNQVSGINFILYYAPRILAAAGLAEQESLLNSIAIGGTNLVFTFVGLYLIDRLGRKTLLLIGSVGYVISLCMVSYAFYASASPAFLLFFLLMFIASHAVGQGAVIWVFISEIFPNHMRARGQALGASVHWVFAALITLVAPVFIDDKQGIFKDNPWPIFAFFACMMLTQLIWVLMKVPETKGVSLEELEKQLIK
ncbi:MAG: sugar porter family MFS transporter [Bacteroidetes bacterium]|nr:sugar porter family MFS transporter [Bacteroidota bacterium]